MPHNRGKVVADGGLLLATGAGVGKVAISDALGNVSWQTFPTYRSWVIPGAITVPVGETGYIPPIFITVPSWSTLSITKVRYVLHAGTSATFNLQQNGANIFTGLVATTTAATTAGSVAVADDDLIQPVVTAISGTPQNLTIEIVIQ